VVLTPGERFGPYEVLALLGAGGMGEVYRARDTRLGRSVALKVLSGSVSPSAEYRQRFEREARTIAALNHPNICTLHDVGRSGEIDYLVMELIEGETLAARLQRGPLPPADVLRIGMEVSRALARAHRVGILHRDLKPGNIMLTKTGAKLMDFGLARPSIQTPGLTSSSQMPTQSEPITSEGHLLGTFQYMAPEQLEGRAADARSDLWSLGVTLYEMATAKPAFEGTSAASLVSSIMRAEPQPIGDLAPMSPPGLDRIVRTCLAKDPEDRWQSAADLERELEWIAADVRSSGGSARSPIASGWASGLLAPRTAALLATMALLGILAFAAGRLMAPLDTAGPIVRTSIPLPDGNFDFIPASALALAPNGSALAITCPDSSGNWHLYIRHFSELAPTHIDTPHGALMPFWSPDSKELAFVTRENRLVRMKATGGPQQTICDAPGFQGGTWNRSGLIVFSADNGVHGLMRVNASGGVPSAVTQIDSTHHQTAHLLPSFAPDGRHFVFTATYSDTMDHFRILVASLDDGSVRDLLASNGSAHVSSDGVMVYVRDRVLFAQRVDRGAQHLLGDPTPLPGTPEQKTLLSHADPGALVAPSLIVFPVQDSRPTECRWFSMSGTPGERLATLSGPFYYAAPAPDGRRAIAKYAAGTESNIWSVDLVTGASSRLTPAPWKSREPYWLSDSHRIIFEYYGPSGHETCGLDLDAPGSMEGLFHCPAGSEPTAVRGDGRAVLLDLYGHDFDVVVAEQDSAWRIREFAHSNADEWSGTWFGDDRWIAYAIDVSGKVQICAERFPKGGHRVVLTHEATGRSPDLRWFWIVGHQLMYSSQDGRRLRAVDLAITDDDVVPGPPHTLFFTPESCRGVHPIADGSRMLVSTAVGPRPTPTLEVIQNWEQLSQER
jgi:eukaryotic-like serine/threonine-protein kinase